MADISTAFGEVEELHFNANSDKLLVCGRSGIEGYEIFSVPGWSLLHSDYSYGDDALSCRFSNDGHYAVGSKDGYVRYYDSGYNLVWSNRRASDSRIRGLAFSPNSSHLLVAWADNSRKLGIFDVSSNTSEVNLTATDSSIYAVDWS